MAAASLGLLTACGGGGGHPLSGPCGVAGPGLTTALVRQMVRQACQEGKLVLNYFASVYNYEVPVWAAQFRAYYGLPAAFSVTNYDNPDMVGTTDQIISEVDAGHPPQFDLSEASSNFVAQLEHAGVLMTGVFNGLPNLTPYVEDGGTAEAFYSDFGGFTYNTSKLSGTERPTTWPAVLQLPPSVEVVSTPYAVFNGALPSMWGLRPAIIFNTLLASRPHYTTISCGDESSLYTSPAAIMVSDCGNIAADTLAAQHEPIGQILPTDGAALSQQYFTIPRGDPDWAAAALFVNFVMTRPAQDVLWRYEHVDYWRVPGSHIAAQLRHYESAGWQILEYPGDGSNRTVPAGLTTVVVPDSALGRQGARRDYFEDTNMAEQAAEWRYGIEQTTPCIFEILKGSANSASCDPFRADIAAAATTAPTSLP